jgi:hypothetical protein
MFRVEKTSRGRGMKRQLTKALAAATLIGFGSGANAGVVVESASNGSLPTAQDLSGYFTTDFNAEIANSTITPHATVVSTGAESEYDYYTFTVATAGSTGLFDIDHAWGSNQSFDSFLALMDMSGNILAVNDDDGIDPGTISGLDSILGYNFTSAGTYAIRVGRCCSNGQGDFVGYPYNGSYQLHVSLQSPGITAAVPEPATWAMMLLGFGGIGMAMRRRGSSQKLMQIA